jgi:signal transduction histidine kinase
MGRRRELVRDWWLPVALGALSVLELLSSASPLGLHGLMLAVLLLICVVLAWRRHRPALVAITAAGFTLFLVVGLQPDPSAQPPLVPFVAMIAALFSLGVHADRRTFLVGAAATAALLGSLEALQVLAGRALGDVVPSLLFWTVAAGTGRVVHLTRRETESERDRARRAEAERDLHAREAADAERTRIARELHDVVAHSLSVIVIQASVEARLLDGSEDSTGRTLRSIETTGRDALVELRRLLGLLRSEGDDRVPLQPLPSLTFLSEDDGLLADVRRAGHEVTLEVRGEAFCIPSGVDLSAYRVVQEALTNVVKHSPGAPVHVEVVHGMEDVRVRVANGPGSPGLGRELGEGGHGIAGMRERVKLYGGDLTASPSSDGGWTVQARFPTAKDRV